MKVIVVPYDYQWALDFVEESQALLTQLGSLANCIHHIGSTSVQGLSAKPIIDMLLDVGSLEELDRQSSRVVALGYEAMGEMGIPRRRYFRKGGYHRTQHIHAFQSGDTELTRHLAFRDYLRAPPEVAKAYGKLKAQVAQQCEDDIERYSAGKNDFIKHHEALALQWYQSS